MSEEEVIREKLVESLKDFHHWTDLIRNGEAEVTGLTIKRVTPQRKPLTDEQIYKLCRNEGDETTHAYIFNKDGTWSVLTLARAIEAAHGIKENT